MKKRVQEPDTMVMPARVLPPITITVTREMMRMRCSKEHWTDDGYVAQCVRSPGHGGHCDFGVYIKSPAFVTVTLTKRAEDG